MGRRVTDRHISEPSPLSALLSFLIIDTLFDFQLRTWMLKSCTVVDRIAQAFYEDLIFLSFRVIARVGCNCPSLFPKRGDR